MEKTVERYLQKHGFGHWKPRAALFDMDGVLYDSMPNHAVAWQKAMSQFGLRMTAHDAYITEGARGIDTIRQMVRQQLGRDISEAEAQRMYDEKSRLFHLMPEAPIMPGVLRFMDMLHKAGLTVGVVTGSGQRPLIDRVVGDFGAYIATSHIVTAYDVSHGKPHPEPYLKGLERCGGMHPWEAIVVENAPLGVKAGVAAGIFTIAVNTGPLSPLLLEEAGADVVCADMDEAAEQWSKLK